MKDKKTLEALKRAKEAVDQANDALNSAIQELDDEMLDQVAGGGDFDDTPTVGEHSYDPNDGPRY